jgi:SAM-dependent methyltransferase
MGDANQRLFLQRHLPRVDGPVIEIGSKDYGSTASFRDLYRGVDYVGADLEAGTGVDVVVDLTHGLGALPEGRFALVICCSVLEHTPRPWVMAENLIRLLRPGGVLYLSVPWVWRYHAYPDDYFRFSPRAVEALFPAFEWAAAAYSTDVPGDIVPLDLRDIREVDGGMAVTPKTPQRGRKYLPYLMVNMLGRRSVEAR